MHSFFDSFACTNITSIQPLVIEVHPSRWMHPTLITKIVSVEDPAGVIMKPIAMGRNEFILTVLLVKISLQFNLH